jgi:AraC-like DNA-binding protein
LIEYVTGKIFDSPTKNILSVIQKDICITERTLQRMFEKNIGVSPNQFRKIHQFNRAFRQLNNRQFQNLSDIAYDNGYADQSHYIGHLKNLQILHLRNIFIW